MPLGAIVKDGTNFEAFSNGNGPALGRELEVAELLRFIKQRKIKNLIWVTADIHYAAAHYYDPAKAQFTEFSPFWEFVAGPLHAGTFDPKDMDNTFGPQVNYISVPKGLKINRSPMEGYQFFGLARINGKSGVMTVSLHNINGQKLYSIDLEPQK